MSVSVGSSRFPTSRRNLRQDNYTYVHSLTYTYDNFTNTSILGTLAVTTRIGWCNWVSWLGRKRCRGTSARLCRIPIQIRCICRNHDALEDQGAQPSAVAGLRWTSDSGRDDVYLVANSINNGVWGYNNLQWLGGTYYHKFNDYWHIAFESWNIHEFKVPNLDNPVAAAAITSGGTPFSPQIMPFNAPNAAHCGNTTALTCTADEQTFLLYVNYSPNKLNNFTLRTEFFMDPQGQRTGIVTNYVDAALAWQPWFSPQIEMRPEIAYYRSLNADAFNGNAAAGIPPSRNWAVIAASDLIIRKRRVGTLWVLA